MMDFIYFYKVWMLRNKFERVIFWRVKIERGSLVVGEVFRICVSGVSGCLRGFYFGRIYLNLLVLCVVIKSKGYFIVMLNEFLFMIWCVCGEGFKLGLINGFVFLMIS